MLGGFMAKIPNKPEDVFPELTDDYKKAFGADLLSIILYGSGASGHYVAGKSDLNFLVVLAEPGMDRLERTFDLIAKWKKRRVATPMVMTKAYLEASLDAYPLELLNMSLHHIPVYGEDVLAGLTFRRECLRLQLERELGGKLLLLRQRFLESEGREKALRDLVRVSLKAFLSAFSGLLYVKGIDIPRERSAVILAVEDAFAIDKDVFHQCLEIREGRGKLSSREILVLFQRYMGEIARLCDKIDELEI
jgi:hypothetical protein